MKSRSKSDPDWKRKVGELLRDLEIVNATFTGQLEFEIDDGEVTKAKKRETFR